MKVLLTDGSGLTSRQVATLLGRAGHEVHTLCPAGLALTRFTRWVHTVHEVPAFGDDPFAWRDAALRIAADLHADVLLPTQEQVTVLSALPPDVPCPLPPFSALAQVQDKVSAHATLRRLGLPQPPTTVAATPAGLTPATSEGPWFVKLPIGTASGGVWRADTPADLRKVADRLPEDAYDLGGVLVQRGLAGPLVMIQAVYDRGRLVAHHANLRVREGRDGGASHKESIYPEDLVGHLERFGKELGWHGACSFDAILTSSGLSFIDVNPRLVEPGNAWHSGVDLVGPLLDIATGGHPEEQRPGRAGTRTHQGLLALLGAAGRGRGAVVRELAQRVRHSASYRKSVEELIPGPDLRGAALGVGVIAALLVKPALADKIAGGGVRKYALSPAGWRRIINE